MSDPHRLQRFVDAQDQGNTYARALSELRAGRKVSHWMWFVFPQIAGLGHSPKAKEFAISALPEAKAYLEHPVLGPRLIECTRAVAELTGVTAEDIFGDMDARKLRSSMTLFAHAAHDEPLFQRVLDQCFGRVADDATERHL